MDRHLRLRCRQADPRILGRRLREARLGAGLTQAQVAGSAMSVTHLSRIEAGLRRPSPELIAAMAAALDLDVAALVSDVPPVPRRDDQVSWAEHLRALNAARATAVWLREPRNQRAYRRMLAAVSAWERD